MKFTMQESDRAHLCDWLSDTTGTIAPPCIEVKVNFEKNAEDNRPPLHPSETAFLLTARGVIDLFYAQKPKQYWKIGRDVFDVLRRFKDDNGQYLYSERFVGEPTLLGYKIEIVDGSTIQFVTDRG